MRGNPVEIVLAPFSIGICFKRKGFAPLGNTLFPFRVDPFSEGAWCIETKTGSHKSDLPFNGLKIHHEYRVLLTLSEAHLKSITRN